MQSRVQYASTVCKYSMQFWLFLQNEVFEDSLLESSLVDSIRSCTTKKFMYPSQTVWTNGQELGAEVVETPRPDL